jgi:hypothetical protein
MILKEREEMKCRIRENDFSISITIPQICSYAILIKTRFVFFSCHGCFYKQCGLATVVCTWMLHCEKKLWRYPNIIFLGFLDFKLGILQFYFFIKNSNLLAFFNHTCSNVYTKFVDKFFPHYHPYMTINEQTYLNLNLLHY